MANATDARSSDPTRSTLTAPALNAIDWIALVLMIIGAINWGLVGASRLDLVATLLGDMTTASRIVYVLVGLAGVYGIVLLARLGRRA